MSGVENRTLGPGESAARLLKAAIDSGIRSPAELASLMGNASVETDGFSTMRENLRYTSVDSIVRRSSSALHRFTREEIHQAVESRDPERIATILYDRRVAGLGNTEPGDGWRFHGRGYFQITGRYNYRSYGDKVGIDLISNPELAMDPDISADIAVAYWKGRVPPAIRADAIAAGRRINGGTHGAERRSADATVWERVISHDLVNRVAAGELVLDDLVTMMPGRSQPGNVDRRREFRELQEGLTRLGYVDSRGQPLVADGDYGRNTRFAVQTFQRDHNLMADGVAGPLTLEALRADLLATSATIGLTDAEYLRHDARDAALSPYRALAPEPAPTIPVLPALRLDDVRHPDHDFYQDVRAQVHDLDRRYSRQPDAYSDNLSAALVAAARADGLHRVDRIELGESGSTILAVESNARGSERRTEVPVMASMNTPLEHSSNEWAAATASIVSRDVESPAVQLSEAHDYRPHIGSVGRDVASEADRARFDPRHADSLQHELYMELHRRIPDASEDRLLQFTSACHESCITSTNLSHVRLDEQKGTLTFVGTGALTAPAEIDLNTAPPRPDESIAQIQRQDHQEAQIMEQVQVQQMQQGMGRSM